MINAAAKELGKHWMLGMVLFERRKDATISGGLFLKRVLRCALIALMIDVGSLATGVIWYHLFEAALVA